MSGRPSSRGAVTAHARRIARRVANSRHRWPSWLDRAVRWAQWRVPRRLVLALTGRPQSADPAAEARAKTTFPEPASTPVRLLIGPANFAGQGHEWAVAVSKHVAAATGTSYTVPSPNDFGFASDYVVPRTVYHRSRVWQRQMLEHVQAGYTHVIIEAERALFGELFRLDAFAEAEELTRRGLAVAMMCHGTDVRLPSHHAARFTWSPFRDETWREVPRLEATAARNLAGLAAFGGPVFVSTPDLLDDLPDAIWCPVVVDPEVWRPTSPALERRVPVVLHAPSKSRIKGTAHVDPVLRQLEAEGLLEYRQVEGLPHAEMPAFVREADIVIDQLLLGLYGVAACEAMAAGRVVVGNVPPPVRARVTETIGVDVPIAQATPDDLAEVVRRLCTDRAPARELAARGPGFVNGGHDGRLSARRLAASFLEVAS